MKTLQRFARKTALALSLSLAAAFPALAADSDAPLQLKVYNADGNSFHVNSVLVTGKSDAILLDAQFSRADAHKLVAEVLASGKQLKAIYVSQGDPDYYFGLDVMQAEFPNVKIYATAPTIAAIKGSIDKKFAFWGPKLGVNAPKTKVIPEPLPAEGLSLEGQKLEVVGLDGELPNRTYVWIPAIKAVVGGVNVFAGLHLWTADTQSKAQRTAWLKTLQGIEARHPATVVPGHSLNLQLGGVEAVRYSEDYLRQFETALEQNPKSADLIGVMKQRYPQAGLGIALDIGAKVNTGEMKW